MKKLNALLDSTTVINLPFLGKLFYRYRRGSFGIILGCTCLTATLYFLQTPLYWSSLQFTDSSGRQESTTVASLSNAIMGDKTRTESSAEIIGLRNSVDFNTRVAERIYQNPGFSQMRFDLNLFGLRPVRAEKIIKGCEQKKECILRILTNGMPKFYSISDRQRQEINYVLEVHSADENTTHIILQEIIAAIKEVRINWAKQVLVEQRAKTLETLKIKKTELASLGHLSLMEQKASLDNKLAELEMRLSAQGRMMVEQQTTFSKVKSQLKTTHDVLNKDINRKELALEKKRQALHERIEALNNDIDALDFSAGQENTDSTVLEQLRSQLHEAEAQLQALGKPTRSLLNTDQFMKKSDEHLNADEMDYNVYKDHLEEASTSYNQMLKQKQILTDKKIALEAKLDTYQPLTDMIKTLQAKQIQLTVLDSSAISNLRFEHYATNPAPVRRIGKLLTMAYMFIAMGLSTTLFLVLRYALDPKIRDEHDLVHLVGQHSLIGIVPEFDSCLNDK